MEGVRRRLTYANVMSSIAVFGVLATGGAYAADTVFSTDIVDGEVKNVDLADNGITSAKIQDAQVKWQDLNNNSVTSSRITDGSVNASDLNSDSVTHAKLADDAVEGAEVKNGSLTASDFAPGTTTAGVARVAPINCVPGSPAFCGTNNPRLFSGTTRVGTNVYCLHPAAGSGLDPVTRPGVVGVDGQGTVAPVGNASAYISTVNGTCDATDYEVHTERIPTSGAAVAAPSSSVAFVITVP